MLSIKTTIDDRIRDIEKAERDAARGNFFGAAAKVRREAIGSIERAPAGVASPPGSPVHTHRGVFFKRAILFAADKDGAVIGPRASIVGEVGSLHEFGKKRDGIQFPKRPTMGPAIEAAADRIPQQWAGTIGG